VILLSPTCYCRLSITLVTTNTNTRKTILYVTTDTALAAAAMEGVEESKSSSTTDSTALSKQEALQRVSKAVELLSKQTVGGNGGTAMKTVLVYVSNILAKPEEDKFRNIRLENAAFKVCMLMLNTCK
jgi:PUB domain